MVIANAQLRSASYATAPRHNSATETVRNFMETGVYSTVYKNDDTFRILLRLYDEFPTWTRKKCR